MMVWLRGYLTVRVCVCVLGRITHCFSTSVSVFFSLPLSPSSTVAPQEQLGIMDGLGDHITVSKET